MLQINKKWCIIINIAIRGCKYLKANPGFLKIYFKHLSQAHERDVKAKQLVNVMISANPDKFIVIDKLLNMANEGDVGAKKIVINNKSIVFVVVSIYEF